MCHTSHGLRTLISVIRNNVELLHKLQDGGHLVMDPRQERIVARIDRASLSMRHVTETLLWLSRSETEALPTKELALDELVRQGIQELDYLRTNRVQVDVQTKACTLRFPEVAARIVLGNLIRNALQHTREGQVHISQQGSRVVIENDQQQAADQDEELGFGLGLQLTEQLTTRVGWYYANLAGPEGYRVTLDFHPNHNTLHKNL